jgi:hypothetical protein
MNFKKLTASICTVAALALAAVPAASAQEQEAMSPEQQYAYTCGHLGTPCDDGEAAKPKRAKRSCSKRSRRASTRAQRSGRRARCGARRAGARR